MNFRIRLTLLSVVVAAIGFSSEAQSRATGVFAQSRENNPTQLRLLCAASGFRGVMTAQTGNRRSARPGDIASGSVLNTPAGELYLNIRPCDSEAFVVVFHQPYTRSPRGQKNCGGQTVNIEQIQQN